MKRALAAAGWVALGAVVLAVLLVLLFMATEATGGAP